MNLNKRLLNFLVIVILSFITFAWTFWIFHETFMFMVVSAVIAVRLAASAASFIGSVSAIR